MLDREIVIISERNFLRGNLGNDLLTRSLLRAAESNHNVKVLIPISLMTESDVDRLEELGYHSEKICLHYYNPHDLMRKPYQSEVLSAHALQNKSVILDFWRLWPIARRIIKFAGDVILVGSDDYSLLYARKAKGERGIFKILASVVKSFFFYVLFKRAYRNVKGVTVSNGVRTQLTKKTGSEFFFFPIGSQDLLMDLSRQITKSSNGELTLLAWNNYRHSDIRHETEGFLRHFLPSIKDVYPGTEVRLMILGVGATEHFGHFSREYNENSRLIVDVEDFSSDLGDVLAAYDFLICAHSAVAGMHAKLGQALTSGMIPVVHKNQLEWAENFYSDSIASLSFTEESLPTAHNLKTEFPSQEIPRLRKQNARLTSQYLGLSEQQTRLNKLIEGRARA